MGMEWIMAVALAAGWQSAWSQPAEQQEEPAAAVQAAEPGGEEGEPAEAPAPKKRLGRARGAKAAPTDPFKIRMAELLKVWKAQMAFGTAEFDGWKEFWTRIRDERAKFEDRLRVERSAFVDSLKSLDQQDHGQSLLDYETMQTNKMKAFEDKQSEKIKEYIQQREAKVREFGIAQEAERERLARASLDSWAEERALLNINLPAPERKKGEKGGKSEKEKAKAKEKPKEKEQEKPADDDW